MTKLTYPSVAVVIPFFQEKEGTLINALLSAENQSFQGDIHIMVIDDESPVPANMELEGVALKPNHTLKIIRQKNGGAGAARNTGLNHLPDDVKYVAFLDSDDSWRSHHLEEAILSLEQGYDFFFSDWWSFNYPDQTNFERIQAIRIENHRPVESVKNVYELGMKPIEHIIQENGGVIQTSTAVFRFEKFKQLRFREEFYNGQDFFFWMDIGELGAKTIFSTKVGCDNGEGINIYQGSGWGTKKFLNRTKNELKVWTSVNRIYLLSPSQRKKNNAKIKAIRENFIKGVLHNLRHRLELDWNVIWQAVLLSPAVLLESPLIIIITIIQFIRKNDEKL